jgi:hypothetical protein
MDTSVPVSGTITAGVFPNRDNTTFPDVEQERREQARQESEWAAGDRPDHPPFTKVGPDDPSWLGTEEEPIVPPSSNRDRATAEADGTN